MIGAYNFKKQYPRVIDLVKKKIEDNPTDVQAHASLSATYLAVGDRAAAVAELELVKTLDSRYVDQANSFIKEIKAGCNPLLH